MNGKRAAEINMEKRGKGEIKKKGPARDTIYDGSRLQRDL